MAMNPMQKKARTSFLLGMFLTLIITGLIIGFLILQISKMNQEKAQVVYQMAYVLNADVQSGDKLQGAGALKQIETSVVPNNAIKAENMGEFLTEAAVARISLRKGTILTTDMVNQNGVENTSDVRLQEYNMVVLPSQLEEGQHVDIRLRLPSGADYIVLSKKYVEQTDATTIWIEVTEEEILTMSNAIVEAYIMEGSLLYATTYTDAGMQNASSPTYIVSQEVINLMNVDPNITATAMSALVQRYTDDARRQRDTINSALNGYSENALPNIEANLAESVEKQQTARQQYVDGLAGY